MATGREWICAIGWTRSITYLERQHSWNALTRTPNAGDESFLASIASGFAAAILKQAREQFEALIPQIPYIGGDENHLTASLIGSARCLALYKAMKAGCKTMVESEIGAD